MNEAEQFDQDRLEAIRWHGVTHSAEYEDTIQLRASQRVAEAMAKSLDRKLPQSERDAASGAFEAWSEVRAWRERSEAHLEEIKRLDAEQDAKPEDTGEKLEDQWHQHQG